MLNTIDTSVKLNRKAYKEVIGALTSRLSEAQRVCREEKIPVMLVFEGWSASGKGSRIGSLIRALDPRGFEVFTTQTPSEEERLHPYMWRFWKRTPSEGRIHIFDRSWYRALMRSRDPDEAQPPDPLGDALSFEKLMTDAGVVIVKMFLHVSKAEQKKRLKALSRNPETAWRVGKSDRKQNQEYDAYLEHFDSVLVATDHGCAKWTVIESDDRRHAVVKVYQTVVNAMEASVQAVRAKREAAQEPGGSEAQAQASASSGTPIQASASSGTQALGGSDPQAQPESLPHVLSQVDPRQSIGPDEYRRRLTAAQSSLGLLHSAMYKQRVPAAIVFEGWDAAGKGGAIKRIVSPLDPRGYRVAPSSAPNDIERAHHYLWRYWNEAPKAGHLTIFDRSWYGRVMVERVEGFCTREEWKRAYQEINDFEDQLVSSGVVLVKFWLHIDQEEQLRRFENRMNDPEKQWKITDEDWRNRAKWDEYLEAIDEMLYKTSTANAPWTIVEAISKPYARVKVAETVVSQLEKQLIQTAFTALPTP
ncbi:MAG: phosphate--AMP phosphotransferase [Clostridiales bacterium]|nr:phosphate--AMP phosphotransferase [Clostridiales bacterium]